MKKKKVLTLIATLTASTLTAITITNRILCKLATSDHYLDEDEGEYYDWRFGKIFYKKEGSGTPLLLVHTLDAAASSAEWKYLMDKLVENHTVYVLDLLGCGKSDKPQITYTNYLYVQLISDFIRNVIGQKTDVIASGNASSFVIMACNMEDSLFRKIMILNPETASQISRMPKGSSRMLRKLLELPIVGTLLYNILYSRRHILKRLEETYFSPCYINHELPKIYAENAHTNELGGKCLMASLKSHFVNINITKALHAIDNSIYLIVGEENPDKEAILAYYCETNPAIETYEIPYSKKYSQVDGQDLLLKQIEIFF